MSEPTDTTSAPILVATDLSDWGDLAIQEGHAWARELGAPLVVIHCISGHTPFSPPWSPLIPEHEAAVQRLSDAAHRSLEERVGKLTGQSGAQVRRVIAVGSPHAEIVRAAESCGAALVVVGARGATGLQRLMLGRTAEKVVRHAHCPVLVVRTLRRTGRILVATDLSPPGGFAVRAAAQVAARRRARLSALYVIDTGFASPMGLAPTPPDAPRALRIRQAAEAELTAHLHEHGAEGDALVAEGSAVRSIEQAARDLAVELVVVGNVGRTGVPRMLLGSTAEALLRDTVCSVLVVRGG